MPLADRPWFRITWPFAVAVVGIGAGALLSAALPGYFVFLAISAVTAAIAILGLGIVTGSAGMIALCQLTFAAVGAWIVSLLNVMQAPGGFLVWLALGGVAAGLVGILVGLPALRLRGVNLAVVTLGFAAAADVTLVQIQFPGSADGIAIERPALFGSDREFFFLSIVVLAVCGLAVFFLQRGRWGASWKAVAFSERGTAAAGQSVRTAKLTAFAVSAALGGISGGLLAGQVQLPFASSFTPLQSLALYVLAIMSGAHLIDMAIFGGLLWVLVPELLKRWGVPQDWGFVVFGVLGVQALTSGTNLGQGIRNLLYRRADRRTATAELTALPPDAGTDATAITTTTTATVDEAALDGAPVLTVDGLTVQFGALKALDDVSFTVPAASIMGLIGPNGAGKSTFVDAISGFLPQHEGRVLLGDRDLAGLSPTRRARLGLRRTFQQDRVPPALTVGGYVRFVARRHLAAADIDEVLAFFGCPPARARLSSVDVGTRRLVEVAANVAARPRLLILDEPAAGLSHEEHLALAARLRELPGRYGVALIIIEHDLDLVRSVCPTLTVLDFGRVLASGPQAEVLANPDVVKAYMGETELLK
ncbi:MULTISPECIES: ABC transporter permease subunit [unclassified Microbacterium]|uniref:branched-chain amino acid ABC transporter ATP-binding protein/permease n=1 Tax=unclassified Microbacterium TaxID=2609290 RepID=UPI002469BA05|nr:MULTISPECIES: ATP-binding cassette domain-containing protein [unclassified Microbacterium]MDH5134945.1 ATP-binding cassette domain-containing protein [Microbacterium sp. RD10]MDH5138430.1 ATP-binding cassette domain-containing protein [Microbacterium sp. RD11]MDH5145307.1 ATP-binding cassette domain-containing protein [Microbacterium sp. RD12]MDH5156569.1 ATP-binding cassette domain-containing protein [Microbacterium sp. RD06]MDH5167924.1 ATP-binding cassette domain-containing protein [Micr